PAPPPPPGPAASAGAVGTVVQEGGRLTVPAGEEGAVTLRFTATLPAGTQGPVSGVLRLPTTLVASAGGSPSQRGALHARDKQDVLWRYEGTGDVTRPFEPRKRVGGGWNTYNALVKSGGWDGVLSRDKDGVLWKYDRQGCIPCAPFEPRQRIGGGWNVYTALAGTAELGRDDVPDLVARDAAGKLWLYQGVPVTEPGSYGGLIGPGPTRSLISGGWNVYDLMF
ncbi:hypothetical protein ACFU8I_41065, partial [Streptomyces sp. NPDC057540]